jgi:hypothetical protein
MIGITENSRDFRLSDVYMLQDSRTILAAFAMNAATFQSFDADFDSTFAAQWEAAIANASNASTDDLVVAALTGLTVAVEEKMEACRVHFQSAKYYIEKAFPNKPAVWKEFGYDNYLEARRSVEKMIVFMSVFNRVANGPNYKNMLVNAGYSEANLDAILSKREELMDAKTDQEIAKNSREQFTQNRIELLNQVWAFRTKVSKAAKYIFVNNFAQYKIYLLPASAESSSSFSITGTVTNFGTPDVIENVLVSTGNAEQDTHTDSNGMFGMPKLAVGSYVLTFSRQGFKTTSKTVTYKGGTLTVNVEMESG